MRQELQSEFADEVDATHKARVGRSNCTVKADGCYGCGVVIHWAVLVGRRLNTAPGVRPGFSHRAHFVVLRCYMPGGAGKRENLNSND